MSASRRLASGTWVIESISTRHEGSLMYLSNQSLLVVIVVGVVAGWLAGRVMEGGGFGLIGDLIVGLLGAFEEQSFHSSLPFKSALRHPIRRQELLQLHSRVE